jgi:hypothetical protein
LSEEKFRNENQAAEASRGLQAIEAVEISNTAEIGPVAGSDNEKKASARRRERRLCLCPGYNSEVAQGTGAGRVRLEA